MILTIPQVAASCGCTSLRASQWINVIQTAANQFAINNPERMSCFLPQIGWESDRLEFTRELWGPSDAQKGYDGRADLGNTQPGDGYLFRGAGLIDITGRFNFVKVRDALRALKLQAVPDFEMYPSTLALPQWAAYSAAWYFSAHGCNELADAGDFETITRRINGGLNGEAGRVALWNIACAQFGAAGGITAAA